MFVVGGLIVSRFKQTQKRSLTMNVKKIKKINVFVCKCFSRLFLSQISKILDIANENEDQDGYHWV